VTDLQGAAVRVADFLDTGEHQWKRNSLTALAEQMEEMAGKMRSVGAALQSRQPEGFGS
jgi:hypothetical protein